MKTGIRKGWKLIGLASGLYREMLDSALTLIPPARERLAGF